MAFVVGGSWFTGGGLVVVSVCGGGTITCIYREYLCGIGVHAKGLRTYGRVMYQFADCK